MEIHALKVKSDSVPSKVAGAIASTFRELRVNGADISEHRVQLSAIGAGAVNQSVKAFAIAKGYVASMNLGLTLDAGFRDLELNGEERTCIEFIIGARFL